MCVWGGEGGGGGEINPCLKLIIIIIEIWHVITHPHVVSENIPFCTKALLLLLMSAFFCKKSAFWGYSSAFTQSNSVRAVLEVF